MNRCVRFFTLSSFLGILCCSGFAQQHVWNEHRHGRGAFGPGFEATRSASEPAVPVSIDGRQRFGVPQRRATGKRYWISPASVRADFWSMFDAGTGWDTLRSRIDVMSMHVNALNVRDTAQMRKAAAMLIQDGVSVNIECGGLRPFSGCDSLAGEHHAQLELGNMRRWLSVGGTIDFVTMDSPINTMIMNGDPSGTCNWTVQRAANEMVDYMKAVRAVIPQVTFALVEPVPWYSVGPFPHHPGNNYGDLLKTLDTVFAVVAQRGESLDIFHSDSPWEYNENVATQGWNKVKAVEDYLHAKGIRHGRIHNSQEGGFQSDRLFCERTLDSRKKYKAAGGDEDEIEIWCWYDHPASNWPESLPYTFAYTCNKFFDQVENGTAQTIAKFEPPDGRVYHGVGQAGTGITEYVNAMGDSSIHPVSHNFYYDIPGTRGNKFIELRAMMDAEKQIGRIPHLSIAMTSGPVWTDSIIATSATYDDLIDSLADICEDFGRRMFVRPGFEFNGSWFPYHPYLYPRAFQKIVDRFRVRGADSTAFLWCYYPAGPNDFDSVDTRGARWYPGDDYVDWFSLDLFKSADFHPDSAAYKRGQITVKGKSERFLDMARAHAKPVFLSEVSAAGMNFTSDSADGIDDWNGWFAPFFTFLTQHTEIKGYNYTNWDWSHYGQWKEWGDSRIEVNPYIRQHYRLEMHNPRYIHLPFGATVQDTTMRLPDQVILQKPLDGDSVQVPDVPLAWRKSQPFVDLYRVHVANDSRFINTVLLDSMVTDTTRPITGVMDGNKYFWRVQSHNALGWGPNSTVWSFTGRDSIPDTLRTTAHLTIDTKRLFEKVEGFGASSNFNETLVARLDETARQQIFDLAFKDLGATFLCIRLYSTFQTSRGGAYNWNDMAAQRLIASEALARRTISHIWLKVSSPPGWMKDNGTAENGGHVLPAHYQDYADYLSYYVRHMDSDYGIPIRAVSIFNEPGFSASYESTTTTPEEYRDILKIVRQTFDRDSLQLVELIGPEVGSIGQNQQYFSTILADSAANKALKRITTHQYGDQLLLYGTGTGDQWDWLRNVAAANDKHIWQSEMFIGGPGMATNDIDEALRLCLLVWNAMTNGSVNAWHYWHYIWPDESTENKSQGLIALTRTGYSLYPRYYAFKHWSMSFQDGAWRIGALSDHPSIKVAAFYTPKMLTKIVVFNTDTTVITTSFSVDGFDKPLRHFLTMKGRTFEEQALIPSASAFTVAIPARSISSFLFEDLTVDVQTPLAGGAELRMTVYPHPVRDQAVVQLSLPHIQSVDVTVHDLLGREVMRLYSGIGGTGMQLPFNATGLRTGVYRLQVRTAATVHSRLLEIVR